MPDAGSPRRWSKGRARSPGLIGSGLAPSPSISGFGVRAGAVARAFGTAWGGPPSHAYPDYGGVGVASLFRIRGESGRLMQRKCDFRWIMQVTAVQVN